MRWLLCLLTLLAFPTLLNAQENPAKNDPKDTALWPNAKSHANSDDWLVKNHDRIRQMRPRLLVLNFSNQNTNEQLQHLANSLVAALAESSRYHGFKDPKAPVFLQYQVVKYLDLRDPGATKNNGVRAPIKRTVKAPEINFDYGALFSQDFAPNYGYRDPKSPERYLRLDELVDQGYIHELWMFTAPTDDVRTFECIELKSVYDAQFRRTKEVREAGNGADPDRKWTGRSLRINQLNPDRGIGCGMENLAHCLEGMANSDVIPYYTRYFREFAGLDLDTRLKLPFKSFYDLEYGKAVVSYPTPDTAVVQWQGKTVRLEGYRVNGGNAHWLPNGRQHYDLRNDQPVKCCIEDWRIGSDPGGAVRYELWTNKKIEAYRKVAPDCMGPWLVYWRQNLPGLHNLQKDDSGRPMKNWLPFLFY